jgi:hypothetical protein
VRIPPLITAVRRYPTGVFDRPAARRGVAASIHAAPGAAARYRDDETDLSKLSGPRRPVLARYDCDPAGNNWWCACLDSGNIGKYQCCPTTGTTHYLGCHCSAGACVEYQQLPDHDT